MTVAPPPDAAPRARGRLGVGLAYAASAVLHGALAIAVVRLPPPELAREEVPVEIVEVTRPAPAEPVPEPPPPAPEPVRPRPAPPVPRDAPQPPRPAPADALPPPNESPPEAPKRAPVRIGVSMSSTTSAGGVAAPVGNTLYGELPRTAPDPADVKPYSAEGTAPPSAATTLPRPIRTEIPRDEYPPAARDAGVEGVVVLQLVIDVRGRVRRATIVDDPGHGFGAAAVKTALAHFVFEPARRGKEPVEATVPFRVRYELQ